MKPTLGRIVHYTNLGDRDGKYPVEAQAALITGINVDGTVALHVFYKTGQFDTPAVAQAPEGARAGTEEARGKWQWPERTA
jgi:hypothetical protein